MSFTPEELQQLIQEEQNKIASIKEKAYDSFVEKLKEYITNYGVINVFVSENESFVLDNENYNFTSIDYIYETRQDYEEPDDYEEPEEDYEEPETPETVDPEPSLISYSTNDFVALTTPPSYEAHLEEPETNLKDFENQLNEANAKLEEYQNDLNEFNTEKWAALVDYIVGYLNLFKTSVTIDTNDYELLNLPNEKIKYGWSAEENKYAAVNNIYVYNVASQETEETIKPEEIVDEPEDSTDPGDSFVDEDGAIVSPDTDLVDTQDNLSLHWENLIDAFSSYLNFSEVPLEVFGTDGISIGEFNVENYIQILRQTNIINFSSEDIEVILPEETPPIEPDEE